MNTTYQFKDIKDVELKTLEDVEYLCINQHNYKFLINPDSFGAYCITHVLLPVSPTDENKELRFLISKVLDKHLPSEGVGTEREKLRLAISNDLQISLFTPSERKTSEKVELNIEFKKHLEFMVEHFKKAEQDYYELRFDQTKSPQERSIYREYNNQFEALRKEYQKVLVEYLKLSSSPMEKQISEITDEHLVGLANCMFEDGEDWSINKKGKSIVEMYSNGGTVSIDLEDCFIFWEFGEDSNGNPNPLKAYQYLKSKGYQLPKYF